MGIKEFLFEWIRPVTSKVQARMNGIFAAASR